MKRETIFSPCRTYRFTLWRQWDSGLPLSVDPTPSESRDENLFVQFIGLNPSTADEIQDDPTIRRCIRFAKDWGAGGFCMTNLFPFRQTNPNLMKQHYPVVNGDWNYSAESWITFKENFNHIAQIGKQATMIVAAWGTHGAHLQAGAKLRNFLKIHNLPVHHLGLNADGSPKHPLYLKASTKPTLWQ